MIATEKMTEKELQEALRKAYEDMEFYRDVDAFIFGEACGEVSMIETELARRMRGRK